MRKNTKLAAGLGIVAGLGITLLPLAASAAPVRTDTLNVVVREACTISGVGLDAELELENIYDAEVNPGQDGVAFVRRTSSEEGGSTYENTFTVVCNYADGYKIVANADNEGKLMGQDAENSDAYIPAADPAASTSYWAAVVSTTGNLTSDIDSLKGIGSANTKIAHNDGASATGGDTFTVEYEVGAAVNQKAGLYSGEVVYTLVRGAI